jgi:hypothetical protein
LAALARLLLSALPIIRRLLLAWLLLLALALATFATLLTTALTPGLLITRSHEVSP